MSGNVVLSDELLVCYENYHLEPRKYKKSYNRLLAQFKPPYLTNLAQLQRCKDAGLNDSCFDRLLPILANAGDARLELHALAKSTRYQFILTNDDACQQLPYVNIKSKNVQSLYTVTCGPGESRQRLLEHIEGLCAKAKRILICDNYFGANWDNSQKLFRAVFPRKPLMFEFVETASNLSVSPRNSTKLTESFVRGVYANWQINQNIGDKYLNRHDRYLLIDNKLEIMLSSGFDYLYKTDKEISCVFRLVN